MLAGSGVGGAVLVQDGTRGNAFFATLAFPRSPTVAEQLGETFKVSRCYF